MSPAQTFLEILQIALATLAAIPATAPEAAVGGVLLQIIQKAMSGYQSATGQALDLTKIPIEAKV